MFAPFADPPSKENPYEDIELENRCVGNKYPVPLSPTLDVPTKVFTLKRWKYLIAILV